MMFFFRLLLMLYRKNWMMNKKVHVVFKLFCLRIVRMLVPAYFNIVKKLKSPKSS